MGRSNSGLSVVRKYGTDYMRDIGRRGGLVGHGGRPRALTIHDVLHAARKERINGKEVLVQDHNPNQITTLAELRAAWKTRCRVRDLGVDAHE
jgi:hypothetical protein